MDRLLLKFEGILFYLIAFLLAFIPLYPKLPVLTVSGTFVAIRLEDFVIALTLLSWGVYLILAKKVITTIKDKLTLALLLFFAIGIMSIFSAVYLTHTVKLPLSLLHFLRRIEVMALLPLASQMIKTRRQVWVCLSVCALTVTLVCLYALGQQYFHLPVISTTNSEFSKGLILYLSPGARINSTFAGHYDLAVYIVMILSILAAIIFTFKNVYLFLSSVAIAGLSFLILIMTAARLSFFAAAAGVILSLGLTGKKMFILFAFGVIAVVLIYPSQLRDRFVSTVTVNLLKEGTTYQASNADQAQRSELNIPTLPVSVATSSAIGFNQGTPSGKVASDIVPGEPVDSTQLGVYRSFLIRLNIEWPRAIRSFVKNPLLGTGYSSLGLATDNDIARSLGEVGLLGTIAFGLVIVEVLKRLISSAKGSSIKTTRYLAWGIFSMVIAFLLNGLVIDVLEASKVATLFWLICGIGIALEKV